MGHGRNLLSFYPTLIIMDHLNSNAHEVIQFGKKSQKNNGAEFCIFFGPWDTSKEGLSSSRGVKCRRLWEKEDNTQQKAPYNTEGWTITTVGDGRKSCIDIRVRHGSVKVASGLTTICDLERTLTKCNARSVGEGLTLHEGSPLPFKTNKLEVNETMTTHVSC